MDCTAKVLRQRKTIPGGDKKSTVYVQIYCPIMGEINLVGERAEAAIKKITEKDGRKGLFK